ncbi:ATP-dependent sacrificial sulfur transferase LarE [Candidatus Sumerlaeota bacterium]|nr:ATP-dependent sacrificial sulfur transferase LarE [Candidatus Sumerlaeota bacterium]
MKETRGQHAENEVHANGDEVHANGDEVHAKWDALLDNLRGYGRLAVAYSGGVDSALLLHAATEALGRENAVGVLASSETITPAEFEKARALARERQWPLEILEYSELDISGYSDNPVDRCYHCKKELFGRIRQAVREQGFEVLADGSSHEDLTDDYRPGMKALRELGVVSPLMELGFRKDDIRAISRAQGLPNWNKPSAACLASRFPYGTTITRQGLDQVARAEAFLRERGFTQVRVRWHESVARIELLPAEIPRLLDSAMREEVTRALKEIGFRYATLDLQGYRTGSLNEGLGLRAADRVDANP